MASLALSERSPLSGLAVPGRYGRRDGAAALVIEERAMAAASVIARRGKAEACAAAIAAGGPAAFAGVGPGRWIATAEGADPATFIAELRARLNPVAAVIDQSDARLVLRLSGPRVRDVLAKGVSIDLHPSAFKVGDVATTLVAHIGVQIDMLDDAPTYLVAAPRSTAGSFWSWLTASAAEFGYEIVPRS